MLIKFSTIFFQVIVEYWSRRGSIWMLNSHRGGLSRDVSFTFRGCSPLKLCILI